MKRFPAILLLSVLMTAALPVSAQQKIAYVDIAAIMKALPDAQEAQRKLDALVDGWQKELDRMEKEWQDKFNDYDKRKLILTDQGRANAERELQDLDRTIAEFRDKKFGQNGELFSKEDALMKPIQDLVFDQVKQLAVELSYDYVLDKSGGVMIIYAKDAYDLTKQVIDRIEKTLPPRQVSGQQGQGQGNTGPGGQQQPPPRMPPGGTGDTGTPPSRPPIQTPGK